MRTMFRRVASVAAATAATAAMMVGTTSQAQAATDDWAGCPEGAVCIYPEGQDPAVSPTHVFWSYGPHNLSGQYGYHWVLNNQTGGARAKLCNGYDGGGSCHHGMAANHGWWTDLTPVNSVVLIRP
jgi:hypothetical protein